MNLINFFSFIFCARIFECHKILNPKLDNDDQLKSLSIALKNITKTLHESSNEVLIVRFDNEEQTIEPVILEHVRDNRMPLRLIHLKKNETSKYLPQNNSIFALNEFEKYRIYHERIYNFVLTKKQGKELRHGFLDHSWLTYAHAFDYNDDDVKEFTLKDKYMTNYYFIIEDENFIELKTFVWFLPGQCAIPTLIEINSFSKKENVWQNSQFKIEKFRNFYGCEVSVLHIGNKNFLHELNMSKDVSYLEKKVLEILRVNLNFKVRYGLGYGIDVKFSITLDEHDSADILYQKLMFLGDFYTQPHFSRNAYFSVPVGELYSGYEKLILPFDDYTWILILLTFFSAFATIFITRFIQRKIRNFIIGQNVLTPSLHIVMIFFGIAQISLPRRNFARFLVMVFILYSLIMRTAWQGKMFEFMNQEMRKPQLTSIEEAINKNYTFYMSISTWIAMNYRYPSLRTKYGKQAWSRLDNELFNMSIDNATQETFKGVVEVMENTLPYQAKITKGKSLKRILRKPLYTKMIGWKLSNKAMVDVFDEKVQKLIDGGFIEYFERERKINSNSERYAHLNRDEPQVLTMKHLEAGFVVWLVSILFAIFAFIVEWISTFINFLIVKNILKAFFQQKFIELQKNRHFAVNKEENCLKIYEQDAIVVEEVLEGSSQLKADISDRNSCLKEEETKKQESDIETINALLEELVVEDLC